MQVVFVGGANGVGASCLAIEIAGQWIIVDCGVRVDRKADPLPDLALLEGKAVRAIFVTHAHADHIGALPLLHRAFPTVPLFASRATGILMEVMLADALKIMNKRAVEEMEMPLYPPTLVETMLTRLRPIPVGETFTLGELADVKITTSRAGHIAGAISFGFTAPDGSLVVSGDISITPQRTVSGALPPTIEGCDLLVLESTYGSRLHPNRQAEELRLAQAVAEGLARGGHTLIPCFGLGRGQELLLLLQAAQQKGQIPTFPIYVDGLVRRVCSTYQLLPEALTPTLQRQIRKGYTPFTGTSVTFVRNEQDRERILAGPPACILSSSGMLTGGPSAWYSARLAPLPTASILITGYQDEESPGKKLLDLADHKQSVLEVSGQQVQVACHVAKYSLSAHADGGELASYAASLHPKRIALVHGDEEARRSLRALIEDCEVLLPDNGETIVITRKQKTTISPQAQNTLNTPAIPTEVSLEELPLGIGAGAFFAPSHLEQLWHTLAPLPEYSVVTARELARIWYGKAMIPEHAMWLLDVLEQDQPYDFPFFLHQPRLKETFRLRKVQKNTLEEAITELVGQVVLIRTVPGASKPALCRSIEPGESLRVQFPKREAGERTRFPLRAVLEAIGPLASEDVAGESGIVTDSEALTEIVRTARRKRKVISAHALAEHCREDETYSLTDLCQLAGVSGQLLDERLAVAKVVLKHPLLFLQSQTLLENAGVIRYRLAPTWREALQEPEELEPPDQNWILSVIEQWIGNPPDLYRRSIDPETGNVMLAFHFPALAQQYLPALAQAAEETGVIIAIAPNTHQGELTKVVQNVLPPELTTRGAPSLYPDRTAVEVTCLGATTEEAIQHAKETFHEQTGWRLTITTPVKQIPAPPQAAPLPNVKRVTQQEAMQYAQRKLYNIPHFYKVGADVTNKSLLLRFSFPSIARKRHAALFEEIEAQTGWRVHIHPTVQQGALIDIVQQLLPAGVELDGTPSLYHEQQIVRAYCTGKAEQEALHDTQQLFRAETDWQLEIILR